MRHPDFLKNDGHDLRFLNKKLGGCRGVCHSCDCADNLRPVLARNKLELQEVLQMSNLPPELIADFEATKNPLPDLSDDKL